jgi:hypothetical protein
MAPAPASAPFRQAGASICWQRTSSEVRQACMGFPEEVSGGRPHAASEPKVVAEGAAKAANFRKVRRLVISMNFIDLSADICLLI